MREINYFTTPWAKEHYTVFVEGATVKSYPFDKVLVSGINADGRVELIGINQFQAICSVIGNGTHYDVTVSSFDEREQKIFLDYLLMNSREIYLSAASVGFDSKTGLTMGFKPFWESVGEENILGEEFKVYAGKNELSKNSRLVQLSFINDDAYFVVDMKKMSNGVLNTNNTHFNGFNFEPYVNVVRDWIKFNHQEFMECFEDTVEVDKFVVTASDTITPPKNTVAAPTIKAKSSVVTPPWREEQETVPASNQDFRKAVGESDKIDSYDVPASSTAGLTNEELNALLSPAPSIDGIEEEYKETVDEEVANVEEESEEVHEATIETPVESVPATISEGTVVREDFINPPVESESEDDAEGDSDIDGFEEQVETPVDGYEDQVEDTITPQLSTPSEEGITGDAIDADGVDDTNTDVVEDVVPPKQVSRATPVSVRSAAEALSSFYGMTPATSLSRDKIKL